MAGIRHLALILILGSIQFNALPAVADNYFDTFPTGIDAFYWTIDSNDTLYTLDDTQGDVRIARSEGGDPFIFHRIHVQFRAVVRGNFNVTVQFSDAYIDRVNGRPGNQIQLNAHFGDQTFSVVRSDEIGVGNNHHVWIDPPKELRGLEPDTVTSGTLRITRGGGIVTGYIGGLQIYSGLFNDDDVTFLSFSLQNNGTSDSTSVTFDNFSLLADSIILIPTSVARNKDVPKMMSLHTGPNPFDGSTSIEYELYGDGPVCLSIFDVVGRQVVILDEGYRRAGIHAVQWNGENATGTRIPSGVYFVRLLFSGEFITRKIINLQ